jgi:hypothetical protein
MGGLPLEVEVEFEAVLGDGNDDVDVVALALLV